jgi:hypothetical protein
MRIEYQMTPEDVTEALRWRAPEQRRKFRRGVAGWVVFFVGAALLFLWLKDASPPVRPGPNAPRPTNFMTDILLPLVPWVLILLFIWFFVFRNLSAGQRKVWENNPGFQQVQTFDMSEEGVRVVNPLSETLYRWNAFIGWAETERLFLLLLPNRARVLVPKRAIGDDAEQQRFRAFVNARACEPTGAFPVVAPKPVLPAAEE